MENLEKNDTNRRSTNPLYLRKKAGKLLSRAMKDERHCSPIKSKEDVVYLNRARRLYAEGLKALTSSITNSGQYTNKSRRGLEQTVGRVRTSATKYDKIVDFVENGLPPPKLNSSVISFVEFFSQMLMGPGAINCDCEIIEDDNAGPSTSATAAAAVGPEIAEMGAGAQSPKSEEGKEKPKGFTSEEIAKVYSVASPVKKRHTDKCIGEMLKALNTACAGVEVNEEVPSSSDESCETEVTEVEVLSDSEPEPEPREVGEEKDVKTSEEGTSTTDCVPT